MVVELHVRHRGDLRLEKRDRAVRLVSLDDEPSLPHTRVPAELRNDPADDPRGIMAELAQHVGHHRGRGRLAMSATDDDRAAQGDELGEELRTRTAFDSTCVGRRDHDLRSRRRRRLTADVDLDVVERVEEDRVARVPALDLGSQRAREVRVRREPRTADSDEVEAPPRQWERAHGPPFASATSSSATTSAASGFASARIASLISASRGGSASSSSTSDGTRASSP